MTEIFFVVLCWIYCMYSSICWRFPVLLKENYFSLKMYGYFDTWSQIVCTVRNCRHCECPAIGIVNCVKVLRPEKSHPMYFRRITHFCESNSNWKNM